MKMTASLMRPLEKMFCRTSKLSSQANGQDYHILHDLQIESNRIFELEKSNMESLELFVEKACRECSHGLGTYYLALP
jgi:hypothetical protein